MKEASYFDQINMAKNWLEYDRKISQDEPALQEKNTSGTDVRRTRDLKLRFVGLTRFVGFNFGHIQLLMFVNVINSVKFKK